MYLCAFGRRVPFLFFGLSLEACCFGSSFAGPRLFFPCNKASYNAAQKGRLLISCRQACCNGVSMLDNPLPIAFPADTGGATAKHSPKWLRQHHRGSFRLSSDSHSWFFMVTMKCTDSRGRDSTTSVFWHVPKAQATPFSNLWHLSSNISNPGPFSSNGISRSAIPLHRTPATTAPEGASSQSGLVLGKLNSPLRYFFTCERGTWVPSNNFGCCETSFGKAPPRGFVARLRCFSQDSYQCVLVIGTCDQGVRYTVIKGIPWSG